MDPKLQKKALDYSIIDGGFSAIAGAFLGGIILTGFALNVLNATHIQIGILASLPMIANIFQIMGAYIIEKRGERKNFCIYTVIASRIVWIPVILLPFVIFSSVDVWKIWILAGTLAVSSLFAAFSGVAWLAWTSDLVPDNILGSYFGKRNMVMYGAAMVAVLLGGKFLTVWGNLFSKTNPYGFIILFALGIIAGLAGAIYLYLIPEADKVIKKAPDNFAVLLKPLKDKNFLMLLIFVSAWMFAIQLAAPFYAVFMIQNLKISFATITVFTTLATLATVFAMNIWGPISDKLGNKPIIIVSGWFLIAVPFIWILPLPNSYYLPLLTAHMLSGAFMAGTTLSQFNMLVRLSSAEGRSAYLALFAAFTGITGAIAPIIGGSLLGFLKNFSFNIAGYDISNLQMLFILSSILQALTVFFILKVKEPKAATPIAVIMQLTNDLNPQTGVASVTDFMMLNIKKTKGALTQIDMITDRLADKSEAKIGKALDAVDRMVRKPIEKIINFFKEE
ncbi:MAG: MFS transporter [Candidatus Omnitrophica bacterium]|nr:MFS transporter [Candidatus Omnitrophota bacterium]